MTIQKITLKDFIEGKPLLEKKKKKPRKKKKTRSIRRGGGISDAWFTHGGHASDGGGIGESLILELLAGITPSSFSANVATSVALGKNTNNPEAGMTTYPSDDPNDREWEEEPEQKVNKVDQARQLFQALYNRPNMTRADIINAFMKDVGVTNSTGVSYYTRFLDEFGLGGKETEDNLGQGVSMGGGMDQGGGQQAGDEELSAPAEEPVEMDDSVDPNRAGIIRTVDNAHLVFKRQSEDGTYEELWVYNIHNSTNDELDIRRDILAGTDIPVKKTKSLDGRQYYTVTTLGNAQLLKVSGLSN